MSPFGNGSGNTKGGGNMAVDLIANPNGLRSPGAAGPIDLAKQTGSSMGTPRPPSSTALDDSKSTGGGGVGSIGNGAKPFR